MGEDELYIRCCTLGTANEKKVGTGLKGNENAIRRARICEMAIGATMMAYKHSYLRHKSNAMNKLSAIHLYFFY